MAVVVELGGLRARQRETPPVGRAIGGCTEDITAILNPSRNYSATNIDAQHTTHLIHSVSATNLQINLASLLSLSPSSHEVHEVPAAAVSTPRHTTGLVHQPPS